MIAGLAAWFGVTQPAAAADLYSNVSVGDRLDGRLELFGMTLGGVVQKRQAYSGAWGNWREIPTADRIPDSFWLTPPGIGHRGGLDGTRFEVFIVGVGGNVYHAWETTEGNWSAWSNMGGDFAQTRVIPAPGSDRIFAVGRDRQMKMATRASSGVWSWTNMGGNFDENAVPAVTTDYEGRLWVFAIGIDGAIHRNRQTAIDGSWTGWATMGGNFKMGGVVVDPTFGPSVEFTDGRIHIFATGANGHLYHRYQVNTDGAWNDSWNSMGTVIGYPKVAYGKYGVLEVFVRRNNDGVGEISHKWQTTEGWSDWVGLGKDSAFVPAAAQGHLLTLELFILPPRNTGLVNNPWHRLQLAQPNTWTGWAEME